MKKIVALMGCILAAGFTNSNAQVKNKIKVATFNVSMEAQNYVDKSYRGELSSEILKEHLKSGENQQIKNIATIINTVSPDIILLNEFDYIANPKEGIEVFRKEYLAKIGSSPSEYPYYYYSEVNTGVPSGFDLDRDGRVSKGANDAWGFGHFSGQYGMILLSKYPIDVANVRTFQNFKWKDMPNHLKVTQENGEAWYSEEAFAKFPLSSKSHWDVPVNVNGKMVHILASHPTPPVFDGEENRNGKRNHDEIRFWVDYISETGAEYIYDDKGTKGGIKKDVPFVILGDLNASSVEGDGMKEGIKSLLNHTAINPIQPTSKGGEEHSTRSPFGKYHTASWRMRADYVLPSKKFFQVQDSGVFWPAKGETFSDIVNDRGASSDHRMVWIEVEL